MRHILLSIYLAISAFTCLTAQNKSSFTVNLSDMEDAHPLSIINEVFQQTGLNLAYESTLLDTSIVHNFNNDKVPLDEVITQLFSPQDIAYKVIGNQLVVLPKKSIAPQEDINSKSCTSSISAELARVKTDKNLEKLSSIKLNSIYYSNHKIDYLVSIDTMIKATINKEDLFIYQKKETSYKQILFSKDLNLKSIVFWGELKNKHKAKNQPVNKQVLLQKRQKEEKIDSQTKHKRARTSKRPKSMVYQQSSIPYNRTKHNNSIQLSLEASSLSPLTSSNTFSNYTFHYQQHNKGIACRLKYKTNKLSLTGGFGIREFELNVSDDQYNPYVNFFDTVSINTSYSSSELLDEYYQVGTDGDTLWTEVYRDHDVYEYAYGVDNSQKGNKHTAIYYEIPLSIAYDIKLAKWLSINPYMKVTYNLLKEQNAQLKTPTPSYINNGVFRKDFFSYAMGLELDWRMTSHWNLYLLADAIGFNHTDGIQNDKRFNFTGLNLGFGVGYNIEF